MRIAHDDLRSRFRATAGTRARGHRAHDRIAPSMFRYDYLALATLAEDIHVLLSRVPANQRGARALDLGSSNTPYAQWVQGHGYQLETLDSDPHAGADHTGEADATGLPGGTFDLVVCTQVLEHVADPRAVLAEIARILKPDGALVASTPHVWFYHPHPGDYWRFTPEGILELCSRTGFSPIEMRAQGGALTTFLQSLNFLAYGVLGRLGAPLYLLVNLVGRVTRPLDRNMLFSHNFAWYARRR